MSTALRENKTIELTVNLKKLTHNVSWKYKAPFAIRNLKRLVQKIFHSKEEVLIAPDLNKAVWVRGMRHTPKKVRVRVERVPDNKDASKCVFKVSLVIVGAFKGLLTQAICE